jgi:hypothetical protein
LLLCTVGLLVLLLWYAVPWSKMRPQRLSILEIELLTHAVLPDSAVVIDSCYVELPRVQLSATMSVAPSDFDRFVSAHTDWRWCKGEGPSGNAWYASYSTPHPGGWRRRSQRLVVDVVAQRRGPVVMLDLVANDS